MPVWWWGEWCRGDVTRGGDEVSGVCSVREPVEHARVACALVPVRDLRLVLVGGHDSSGFVARQADTGRVQVGVGSARVSASSARADRGRPEQSSEGFPFSIFRSRGSWGLSRCPGTP